MGRARVNPKLEAEQRAQAVVEPEEQALTQTAKSVFGFPGALAAQGKLSQARADIAKVLPQIKHAKAQNALARKRREGS